MGLIYKITNQLNNKVYIGKTVESLEERWKEHKLESRKPIRGSRPLYAAIQKYGLENFKIELIEDNIDLEQLNFKEQYWIQYYNSYIGFKYSNGYNATLGGDGTIKYDYKTIANYYLQVQNISQTAKYFDCCYETVKRALLEYNIETNQQVNNKKIRRISLKTNRVKTYVAITDAAKEFANEHRTIETARKAISKAIRTHKPIYGFIWEEDINNNADVA